MKKRLLLILCLLPFLSFSQWRESFELSPDTADYGCWAFNGAAVVPYAGGYAGWERLVRLDTLGGYLETPVLTVNEGHNDWLNFQWYATQNAGREAVLAVEYVNMAGTASGRTEITLQGNGNGWQTVYPPAGFRGEARVRFFVSEAAGALVYIDNLWGQQLEPDFCQTALPVTLVSFTASGGELHWHTATERGTERFVIEQSTDGREFGEVGAVKAAGTTSTRQEYSYAYAPAPGTQYFRLRIIDTDGSYELSRVISVEGRELVRFGPFEIGSTERVASLAVLDIQGRVVASYQEPQAFPAMDMGKPLILQLVTDRQVRNMKVYYK